MIKLTLIISYFILSVSVCLGQDEAISGKWVADTVHRMTVERVRNLVKYLDKPNDWKVYIVDDFYWDKYCRPEFHDDCAKKRTLAVTHRETRETLIQFAYIEENWNNDKEVLFTLAHELGHIICDCSSEDKADKEAKKLLKKRELKEKKELGQ